MYLALLCTALVLAFFQLANHAADSNQLALQERIFCASTIYTGDSSQPVADCLSVVKDKIVDVFNKTSARLSNAKEAIFLDGVLTPGFIDSHGHILHYGEVLSGVDLRNTKSIGDAVDRVVHYRRKHPKSGSRENWIQGMGWDQGKYGGSMPTAANLSHLPELADLYIMLDSHDAHCKWVSEAVLALLSKKLHDVPGGEIIRNPGLGVFCNKAMSFVLEEAPAITTKKNRQYVQLAMTELNKIGITGVHDAGMVMDIAETFSDMASEGLLTLRIYAMLKCSSPEIFCFRDKPVRKIRTSDDLFTMKSVKLFADNTLGSWGAAMLQPYSDRPNLQGKLNLNESDLSDFVAKIYEDGWQINVHAIGDHANRAVLSAYENVIGHCEQSNKDICNQRRLRIEHAQILTVEDQARIARLGIIASIMPTHATSDMHFAIERLGSERLATEAYRQKSLHRSKSRVILGSDFPVEPPTPFGGMYAAVTRLSPATGTSPHGPNGWFPQERLSVEEAFAGFTREAAYGSFWEGKAGCIANGAWADFVLLDRDLFSAGLDLRSVKVQATWVGGKKVWDGRIQNDTGPVPQVHDSQRPLEYHV